MEKVNFRKIVSIASKVLMFFILLLCLCFIILTLAQRSNNGLATLFGYSPLSIQSDSMDGDTDENFKSGDLIIVKALSEDDIGKLKEGEIITFRDIINGKIDFNTHRIEKINEVNGGRSFITKGDNNLVADDDSRVAADIVAVYKGTKIKGAGTVLDFLNSKNGFFLCLVLPLGLFFIWRLFKLVSAVNAYRKVTAEESAAITSGPFANFPDFDFNAGSPENSKPFDPEAPFSTEPTPQNPNISGPGKAFFPNAPAASPPQNTAPIAEASSFTPPAGNPAPPQPVTSPPPASTDFSAPQAGSTQNIPDIPASKPDESSESKNIPNQSVLADILADANIDAEFIAAAMKKAAEAKNKDKQ